MKRHCGIAVTNIDNEYGFTSISLLHPYTGAVVARMVISIEEIYNGDDHTETTVHNQTTLVTERGA